MTTPVRGPDDVKVGDVVRIDIGNSCRQKHVNASVVKVNASVVKVNAASLTVLLPDGTKLRKAYASNKTTKTFRQTRRVLVDNFHRLDAFDRWEAAKPDNDCGSPSFGAGMKVVAVVSMADAVRDRPDDVIAQIRALSEWLRAEPSKGEP